ncbi:threonine--tRNA ligase [Patescibacteria group bacterium]|nr:threonine--tRNA ligase [Patescibacteria group bacterium]
MKDNKLKSLRHTAEHVLMQAMDELFPGKIIKAMGPATDHGFYFDFDTTNNFKISELDFEAIEKKMQTIIDQNIPLTKKKITPQQAKKIFKQNPYKLEWINEAEGRGNPLTVYYTGTFVDLCSGPHVKSTGEIKAFKLLSVAGAYWRGSEKNKMLTRIYGTAFENQKELTTYIHNLEEAKKRDHRKLGKELDLFSFHKEGPGFVFWHPKGHTLYQELIKYWRKIHTQKGYVEIKTPTLLTIPIWKKSGHMENFIDKMYLAQTVDSKKPEYAIKPMNCDGGMLIYASNSHSYRELPIRMGELGVVHRYESSGEIHGLMRVREFTQDDAHIYCTPNQVKNELKSAISLCKKIYQTCGLPLDHIELSTRPKKSIGSAAIWKKAEDTMKEVLKENNIKHSINEGDGAFYGPKLDFHLKDCLDRTFQCGTIQLDFAQPNNFDLTYTNKDGLKKRPIMIHRTIYGSLERFIGLLVEHFAGAFPIWLSPVQVAILPISEKFITQAEKIYKKLTDQGIRVELDTSNESLGKKIRNAETQKTPYMLILGQKEIDQGLVSIRQRGQKDLGQMTLALFSAKILQDITDKLIF